MKIGSIKDPRVVRARQLTTSQGRRAAQQFLLEGKEQLSWGLEARLSIEGVFIYERAQEDVLIKDLERLKIPYNVVSEGILKKITDTSYLVPIVGVAKNPDIADVHKDFVIVLDNLIDQGNIGTIVRSAHAFGIDMLISTRENADFFYKKIIDASRGTIFRTHLKKFDTPGDTIRYLKNEGYFVIATSPHAHQLQSMVNLAAKPVALVLGNETNGCSQEFIQHADLLVQIPMKSDVESLNVAVAAGISIYELKIKLVIAMLIQKIYKNLGRQFGVTVKLIQQAFDVELKKVTSLSALQVILLMIAKCDRFMSIDQVMKDIGEHGEGLGNFLAPLRANEYINDITQDGVSGIVLTKRGEELIAKLWPVVEATEERILDNFSPQDRAQLIKYITQIHDNCYKIIADNASHA